MSNFSDMLVCLRKQANLTQQELANATGLSRSVIGMYETEKREPDFETLEVLADYFNVNMDTLLGKTQIVLPDAFTYAMQNECRDLTDEDKALLISMAKQLSSARKAKNGQTD